MDEQTILDEFASIEERSIDERLQLFRNRCPKIWADAESYVTGRRSMPWDFASGFEVEAQALRDKYQVHVGRQRPRVPQVSAVAALFCATCELLDRRLRRRMEQNL